MRLQTGSWPRRRSRLGGTVLMAIYDRPVRLLMREMIDELAPNAASVFTRHVHT